MLLNTKTSAGFFSAECTSHTKIMALFCNFRHYWWFVQTHTSHF